MKKLSILQHSDFGQVRNVVIKGEPWFMGKDICQVLGIANHKDALGRLDEDERCGVGITDPIGRAQEATFVSESGLYSLVMQSRKPEAKAFRKWVTSEVLPSIRKYGFYVSPSQLKTTRELRAMERAYHAELEKYITPEDIYQVSRKKRMDEFSVRAVLCGSLRDDDVMRALRERALANKRTWTDPYSPEQMDEAVSILKQPRS